MRLKNMRKSVTNKARVDQERKQSRPHDTRDQNCNSQVETKRPTRKYADDIGREECKPTK